ncbi:Csa1 family protein, partial [Staphylococcus aureus]|uniref:Csa1 family protein n=1 Tax=Staphylococcus aureus TaxID=1280 RepID=UPI0011A4960A
LYDKETYPHDQFHKNHKPTSIINSQILLQPKPQRIKSEPILLYINTNTNTTTPNYILTQTLHHQHPRPNTKHKQYPLKILHNKIIPT